jgi:molybdopterin molybdotransferase
MNADSFKDVRMKGFAARTSVAEAQRLIDDRCQPLSAETILSPSATGRVLAQRVVSPVHVPGFAKSAMDGYAVRGSGTLTIIGTALPGSPFTGELQNGQAIRIMTGAVVPPSAEVVVPVEHATESDGRVRLDSPPVRGKHIIAVGEDVAKGAEVFAAGRRLRPQDVGMLAAIGAASVEVVHRPRVAVLVTGDELLPPGSMPRATQIVDSNSPMLAALIQRDGGVLASVQYVKDDLPTVREAIRTATADVIFVSGGSSVGQEDHAPRAVADLGELAVHGIAIKPASPAGIGFLRDPSRIVFLLPGHPVSCLCAYDAFAGRAIRLLGGRNPDWPYSRVHARLGCEVPSAEGRVDYVRVKLKDGLVMPLASGASRLSSVVEADGFILIPAELGSMPVGELVEVYRFDS